MFELIVHGIQTKAHKAEILVEMLLFFWFQLKLSESV